MVTVLKSGLPTEELKKKLDEVLSKNRKGVDTSKYCGVIKTNIDPLEYQQKIRKEW